MDDNPTILKELGKARSNYVKDIIKDIERIISLNKIATDNLEPDLTIVFDVATETAMQRVGDEKDRLEQEGIEFHRKLCQGYLELAKKFPERIKTVNANLGIDEVFEQVKKLLN